MNGGRERRQNALRVIGLQAPHQRRHQQLGANLGVGCQRPPHQRRHRVLAARGRRVVPQRNGQRAVEIRRRHRIGSRGGERGTDRRIEWRGDDRVRQPARRQVGGAGAFGGGIGRRDRHRIALPAKQIDDVVGQRFVTGQGHARQRPDTEDLLDDVGRSAGGERTEPGVADAFERVEAGLGVGRGRHAHAARQRAQPVQPRRRGILTGPRMTAAGLTVVGDRVARGHRVDGDQQVRIHRQTQPPGHGSVGVGGRARRELGRAQQGVQSAPGGQ